MLILIAVLLGIVMLILAIAEARRVRDLDANDPGDGSVVIDGRVVHPPDKYNQEPPELFEEVNIVLSDRDIEKLRGHDIEVRYEDDPSQWEEL